jgi:hypothetical protein
MKQFAKTWKEVIKKTIDEKIIEVNGKLDTKMLNGYRFRCFFKMYEDCLPEIMIEMEKNSTKKQDKEILNRLNTT